MTVSPASSHRRIHRRGGREAPAWQSPRQSAEDDHCYERRGYCYAQAELLKNRAGADKNPGDESCYRL